MSWAALKWRRFKKKKSQHPVVKLWPSSYPSLKALTLPLSMALLWDRRPFPQKKATRACFTGTLFSFGKVLRPILGPCVWVSLVPDPGRETLAILAPCTPKTDPWDTITGLWLEINHWERELCLGQFQFGKPSWRKERKERKRKRIPKSNLNT